MNKLGMLLLLVGITVGALPAIFFAGAANGQDEGRPAELNELNGFVGEWDGQFGSLENPREKTIRTTSEWVLDDRFVLSKGSIRGDDESHSMILWTYDTQKKAYRRWFFFSSGGTLEEVGQYDLATKTFHFQNVNPEGVLGMQTVSTVKVESDDAKSWSMEFRSPNRPPVKVVGTATKRK